MNKKIVTNQKQTNTSKHGYQPKTDIPSQKRGYQPSPTQQGDKKTGYQPPIKDKAPVAPPKQD